MPIFEVEWTAQGICSVEADDADEAEKLARECVEDFDTMQLEQFSVDGFEVTDVTEQ